MNKITLFLCTSLLILSSCSAYLETFTSITEESVDFESTHLKSGGLVMVPLSGGNRAYYSTIKENSDEKLSAKLGSSYLNSSQAARKLNEHDLVQQYRNTINTYEETGISDQKKFIELGEALGTRYLLRITLQDISSQKEVEGTDGEVYTNESREGRLNAQLWDCSNGNIVWEGSGWTEAEENMFTTISDSNHEFLARATRGLINRLFEN